MDGVACALEIYAPRDNFSELTKEMIKFIKAARKEKETRKKEAWALEYDHRGSASTGEEGPEAVAEKSQRRR